MVRCSYTRSVCACGQALLCLDLRREVYSITEAGNQDRSIRNRSELARLREYEATPGLSFCLDHHRIVCMALNSFISLTLLKFCSKIIHSLVVSMKKRLYSHSNLLPTKDSRFQINAIRKVAAMDRCPGVIQSSQVTFVTSIRITRR